MNDVKVLRGAKLLAVGLVCGLMVAIGFSSAWWVTLMSVVAGGLAFSAGFNTCEAEWYELLEQMRRGS